jgi:formylglycine-generating enzyme required for sulfatase activity
MTAKDIPLDFLPAPTDAGDEAPDRRLTITSPIELELVRVPAGEFQMGSNPALDKQAAQDEQPQHWVDLPEFYIGKTPVTNAQYLTFVRATKHRAPSHWRRLLRPAMIPQDKETHPVVFVSWHDAVAFCQWLGRETGRHFRLPTEAEWEKAARGTDGRLYPWGNAPPTNELCNFLFSVKDTSPVGRYAIRGDSPYSCADMAGNVWEWTHSLYREYPYHPSDGRQDSAATGHRVARGGACFVDAEHVRCAFRGRNHPHNRYNHWGFRVALDPTW